MAIPPPPRRLPPPLAEELSEKYAQEWKAFLRDTPRRLHQVKPWEVHWANPDYAKAKDLALRISDLKLIPAFAPRLEQVLRVMRDAISLAARRGEPCGWVSGDWKKLSSRGYDVRRGVVVDYGNQEYQVVLLALIASDRTGGLKAALTDLSTTYPSLHPRSSPTDHAVSMKGDVIEIFMAVLRGETKSPFDSLNIVDDPSQLPLLFAQFTRICQAIHVIDAHLASRKIKYKNEWISQLAPQSAQLWWQQHYPGTYSAGFLVELARVFNED